MSQYALLDQPLQCVKGSVLSLASPLSRLYTTVESKETMSIELNLKKLDRTHVQISTKVNRRNVRGQALWSNTGYTYQLFKKIRSRSILVKPINIYKSGLDIFVIIIAYFLLLKITN